MRAFVAIAVREVAQRWVLIVVAAVLGWVPVAVMYFDMEIQIDVSIAPLALYAIVRVFWVVAFAIGMSLLGRQLHGGQLAFYFARPISGCAIAGGKVLGAAAALVVAELLVLAPCLPFHIFDSDWLYAASRSAPGDVVAGVLLFLGGGLVAGVLARSRSRWFAIDAAGLMTIVLLGVRLVDRLTILGERYMVFYNDRWQRPWRLPQSQPISDAAQAQLFLDERHFAENVHTLWVGLGIAAAVALLAAAAAAVAFGRTDGERAHRALSTTMWSSLCAVGAAGLAVAHWGLR